MEVILTESYLPPKVVRGAPADVVSIELHSREAPLAEHPSLASHGCVLLSMMPQCIYVRIRDCSDIFLTPTPGASQPGDLADLRGVLAVEPVTRPWEYKQKGSSSFISVARTQCPLLPQKQCTLHGVQGKTADPGFIAHWKFPKRLPKESIWLAYYVSLSRPRSFSRLLCHGSPDRDIIEEGPPESLTKAFDEFFAAKIAATRGACAKARAELGWPVRAE
jgi:hypothetical protein